MPPAMMLARKHADALVLWKRSTSAWRFVDRRLARSASTARRRSASRAFCIGSSKHEKTMHLLALLDRPARRTRSSCSPSRPPACCRALVTGRAAVRAAALVDGRPGRARSWLTSSSTTFRMSRTPVPFGTSTGSHVRSFGGSVEHLVLRAAQHHAVQLHGQLLEVRRAVGLPAEVVVLGGAVALREREKAAPKRMADELQQDEQIARPIRQRRAGEAGRRPARSAPRRRRAPRASRLRCARVILQVVRLVEDEPGPRLVVRARRCVLPGCRS